MTDAPEILLAHHLKTLKLPTFLREYEKLARQCAAEGLDHVRFLARLVELELIDRERRMIERRIKAARFPAVKSLDSFDFKAIPALNKMQVLELARCEWIERRENVIALGPSGTERRTQPSASAWPPARRASPSAHHRGRPRARTDGGPQRTPAPAPAEADGRPRTPDHRRRKNQPPWRRNDLPPRDGNGTLGNHGARLREQRRFPNSRRAPRRPLGLKGRPGRPGVRRWRGFSLPRLPGRSGSCRRSSPRMVTLVGQRVEQRAGEALGAEGLGPLVEGQVAGDQAWMPRS